MSQYHGDIDLGDTIQWLFTTVNGSGVPTQLTGSPTATAYTDGGLTQSATGVTLTADFDGVTGLNLISVVATSGNGFAAGENIEIVLDAGTVGGNSVVGYAVGGFSIANRSPLRPTTAGRTLDVSATGEAGLDWANIGSPTTAQNLSGTNIDPDQVVASVSGAVGSVTGAVGSVTAAVTIDAASVDAIWDETMTAHVTADSAAVALKDVLTDTGTTIPGTITTLQADTDDIQTRLPAALVGGAMDCDVSAMQAGVITAAAVATDAIDADALATDAVEEIADQVWNEDATGHQTLGTFGQAIGDPAANSETIYDAVVTDAAGTNVAADVIAVKAETALIVADTNELQTDWADAGRLDAILDARASQTTADAIETDTQDIQSRLPAALVGGKMDSDATAISGDTTAADRLEGMMDGIIVAQVNDASATTTAFAADQFTETTDDHFNGRLITFITGNLAGQQTDITDYDAAGGAQGSQQFTVTALTEAPANDDFFVIH